MKHRDEIDGLRAVAVLPVLLSHAGYATFAGGFLGVDIFFVISGFLITGIITAELDENRFSLANFYERRARRILPALFVVMAMCIPFGWFLMGVDTFRILGQSLVATTLFSNNILLNLTSGYWDTESAFKPLLHTWSLGVEEQYYVIVPIILMVVYKVARHHAAAAIRLLGLASFVLCLWAVHAFPVFDFYQLPTRAWELAIGGLTSFRRGNARTTRGGLATLGLVLILAAMALTPAGTATPSAATLVPVLGAALILADGRAGIAHWLLSLPVVRGLGLISYSAYLWHQPLFAFLRIASRSEPAAWQFALMIVAALVLALLTWRFVEQPFRDRRRIPRRTLIAILLPAAMVIVGAGAVIDRKGGLPGRFEQPMGAAPAGTYKAFNERIFSFKRSAFAPAAGMRILVLGNSTGRDFMNMALETPLVPGGANYVYRDDLILCRLGSLSAADLALVRAAQVIVSVYDHAPGPQCDGHRLAQLPPLRNKLVFVGPKDFGVNLNPYARLPLAERPAARTAMSATVLEAQREYRALTPPALFVDVIGHLSSDGRTVPVFDEGGRALSEDRVHLTRAGAVYVGRRVFADPIWAGFLPRGSAAPSRVRPIPLAPAH